MTTNHSIAKVFALVALALAGMHVSAQDLITSKDSSAQGLTPSSAQYINSSTSTPVSCLLSPNSKELMSLISLGHTSFLDTYLSQEKASGWEVRYTWEKTVRKPNRRWSSLVMQQAFISVDDTRGNDNSFIGAMYNLRFGWHRNFDFPAQSLNLKVGGLADLSLGGTYNTRNSNNPAQARASLSIDPSALLTWHFRIHGKPLALHYEVAVPLVGIAFSPNYGQSYYEIFTQGNYDHNVVFTSPASGLQLHHILALDFRLWRTTFTVGYLGDIRQMKANGLKYHRYSHAIGIGWRY